MDLVANINKWQLYCHVYNGSTYSVFKNSALIIQFPSKISNEDLYQENLTLLVGKSEDGDILRGSIASVTVWKKPILMNTIMRMFKCQDLSNKPAFSSDDISTKNSEFLEFHNVSHSEISRNELCRNVPDVKLFDKVYSFDHSRRICEAIGESLYVPQTTEDNEHLFDMINDPNSACKPDYFTWINIMRYKDDVWKKVYDNSTIPYDLLQKTNLPSNYPNDDNKCAVIYGKQALWKPTSCNRIDNSCAACLIKHKISINLRGLCLQSEETLMDVRGYINQSPYFHGYYGIIIHKSSDKLTWELKHLDSNITYARMQDRGSMHFRDKNGKLLITRKSYPLGKKNWEVINSFCDYEDGESITLILSRCNTSQYTCSNLACIPSDKFCDGYSDCSDASDENYCQRISIPKGYDILSPPDSGSDISSRTPTNIAVEFNILRFTRIDEMYNTINIVYSINFKWQDLRLTYYNLENDTTNNRINARNKKIWLPKLTYPTLYDGNMHKINGNGTLAIIKSGVKSERAFNSTESGTRYFCINICEDIHFLTGGRNFAKYDTIFA